MSGSPPAPYMHMHPPQPGMQMVYAPAMAPQHIPYGAGGPPVAVDAGGGVCAYGVQLGCSPPDRAMGMHGECAQAYGGGMEPSYGSPHDGGYGGDPYGSGEHQPYYPAGPVSAQHDASNAYCAPPVYHQYAGGPPPMGYGHPQQQHYDPHYGAPQHHYGAPHQYNAAPRTKISVNTGGANGGGGGGGGGGGNGRNGRRGSGGGNGGRRGRGQREGNGGGSNVRLSFNGGGEGEGEASQPLSPREASHSVESEGGVFEMTTESEES